MEAHWFSKATTVILIPVALIMVLLTASAGGVKHIVGGSVWSIPPSKNFYSNWSESQVFHPGDVLYFDFDAEMYNVHKVSGIEYSYCESDHPENVYEDGPVEITLAHEGYFNFICFMMDYCSQGLKLTIHVTLP